MKKIPLSLLAFCIAHLSFGQFNSNNDFQIPYQKKIFSQAGGANFKFEMTPFTVNGYTDFRNYYATGKFNFYVSGGTHGGQLSALTINSNGNVGIGISSPDALLDVKYTGSPIMNIYRATDANNQYRWRVDQNFEMFLTNSSGLDIVEIGQDKTYFNNGNVGIGTTSPNERLSVVGQNVSFLSNSPYNIMKIGRNSTERLQFQVEDNNAYLEYFQDSDNNGAHIFHIRNRADGSSPDNDIRFSTSGEQRLAIKDNGNIGIGTTTPNEKLSVLGQDVSLFSGTLHNLVRLGRGSNENMSFRVEDYHSYFDYNQDSDDNADHILYIRNLAQGNSANNDIRFATGGNTHVILKASGNLGLGTSTPGEKLEVNGNALIDGEVYSKKVKVSVNPGNWPDYVFAKSYELRALSEVEDFVKKNGHLPEVPSANEVEKEGLDLGNMDATLLKKVEELTLYMIEQNKRLDNLEKENSSLKKEIKKLKRNK